MRTALFSFLMLLILQHEGISQFITLGTAQTNGDCVILTPDEPYAEGLAYSSRKIDLGNPFAITFDIFLGDKNDDGADGIAFVMHNDPRGFDAFGTWGESLGYGRMNPFGRGTYIAPSIAVEFDTYYNERQNDPQCDHVAYLQNGVSYHLDYWNGGNPSFNLEDGKMHEFSLVWDPSENLLTVFLDGNTVYKGQEDLINNIFEGSTEVIWGFTGSTGRLHNLQYFCLRRLVSNKQENGSTEILK